MFGLTWNGDTILSTLIAGAIILAARLRAAPQVEHDASRRKLQLPSS